MRNAERNFIIAASTIPLSVIVSPGSSDDPIGWFDFVIPIICITILRKADLSDSKWNDILAYSMVLAFSLTYLLLIIFDLVMQKTSFFSFTDITLTYPAISWLIITLASFLYIYFRRNRQ